MDTMRAFIAVEIDEQARQRISWLVSELKKSDSDVKWITEDQMHLTLKFLGNTGRDKIQGISDALSDLSNSFKSFAITFSDIGAFPSLDHPRVIWLGIDKGAKSLEGLAEKIEAELEKIGFQKDDRGFKPHLTLGRVKSSKNIAGLIKLCRENRFDPISEVEINKVILFQSDLSPKGAVYSKLSTAELAA